MDGLNLTKKQQEILEEELSKLSLQEVSSQSLSRATTCFEACVNNFRKRTLDDEEELCFNRCFDKQQAFNNLLTRIFEKVQRGESGPVGGL
eukprot:gene7384-9071_t